MLLPLLNSHTFWKVASGPSIFGCDCASPPIEVTAALNNLNDQSGCELLKEELELKKAMSSACTALQVKRLDTASVVEMVKNASLLALQGVCLPVENKLHFTWRMATVHLSDSEVDRWLSCLSWLPQPEWTPQSPTFGACVAALGSEDPLWQLVKELFVSASLPDAWMRQLNAACDSSGNKATVSPLLKLCRSFLHQHVLESGALQNKEVLASIYNNVAKVMRGIVALTSPVPSDEGSCHTTAPILTQLPRVGRLIVNKLRRETVCFSVLQPFLLRLRVCRKSFLATREEHDIHPIESPQPKRTFWLCLLHAAAVRTVR